MTSASEQLHDHRTRVWREGAVVEEGISATSALAMLRDPACLVWIGLTSEQVDELELVGKTLGFNAHAIEDARSGTERVKIDRYPDVMFLNVRTARLTGNALATDYVAGLITRQALVTVTSATGGVDFDELLDRWNADSELAHFGPLYLVHGLLDQVVDDHFSVAQTLAGKVDDLEDELFEGRSNRPSQQRMFRLRRNIMKLRHIAGPTRDVAGTLLHDELEIVPRKLKSHFRDVYDHAQATVELTATSRELMGTMLETRIAMQSNRMNEVMKQVTSWAAIIAVPTAITGFFGMNVLFPGTDTTAGFLFSLALIAACSIGLFVVFKRNKWL